MHARRGNMPLHCVVSPGDRPLRCSDSRGGGTGRGRGALRSVLCAECRECPVTPVCPVSVYKPNAKAQSPGALSTGLRCRSRPAPSRSAARAPPAPSICGAARALGVPQCRESSARGGNGTKQKGSGGSLGGRGRGSGVGGGATSSSGTDIYTLRLFRRRRGSQAKRVPTYFIYINVGR